MSVPFLGMIGLTLPTSRADLLRMLGLQVNYTPLPPINSPARAALIDRLSTAFGRLSEGIGAQDAAAVYNELSQLSYHDRITILREVYRSERQDGADTVERLHSNPEAGVRLWLLNRLAHTRVGSPPQLRFSGVNQFFHLMSDAPQDAYYEGLLKSEIRMVLLEMPEDRFNDRFTEPYNRLFPTFMRGTGVTTPGNPYQRMTSIGIVLGNPPLRTANPLGLVAAPVYQQLPALDSEAGQRLVEQLSAAAGPMFTNDDNTTLRGFQDPETFFRIMARYPYAQRFELFRAMLRDQGEYEMADLPERNLRFHMMNRLRRNGEGALIFAGVERFFRLMSDAPRDRVHHGYLQSEMVELLGDTDHTQYIDRAAPGITDRFRIFHCIAGFNRNLLTADPYNRLELIGITWGRPPVLPPVAAPPRGALLDSPNLWDRLDTLPDTTRPRGILDFSLSPETALCSLSPVEHAPSINGLTVYSPLITV